MWASAVVLLGLAACAVGPTYQPPSLAVPGAWSEGSSTSAELSRWWGIFGDPLLESLVARALAANLDLGIAEARVSEARALSRVAGAGLWPAAEASASYTRSERGESAERSSTGEGAGGSLGARSGDLFRASIDALWEIDLFGGTARSVEAAQAEVEVAVEQRRAALVRLLGDVAATYVEARSLQSEIATTRKNAAAQRETLELTEASAAAGLGSDLDVERAKAQVASTSAELPLLEASLRAVIHRLGVLLGAPPDRLLTELAPQAAVPRPPAEVARGVPADLLRRRPDVRSAERALAAATARIGEAEADLYPRLTLTGSVGFRSEQIQDLVSGKSLVSSFGPAVVWPIFDAGRIRANVDVQEARQEQALLRYQAALLRALEEAESAYARYAREGERQSALGESARANREAVALASSLYANGLGDFLAVLDAERSLFEAERLLARSDAAVATNLVGLYVALGGGWGEEQQPK